MDARSVDNSEFVVTPESVGHLLTCNQARFFDAVRARRCALGSALIALSPCQW
jgi:hypothetical protein